MGVSHRRIADIAALAIVAGLFATNVYRAATQSFTCDEAFSCKLYMDAPIGRALTTFHANDHVLYTFVSRAAAGLSADPSLRSGSPAYLADCYT